MVAVTLSSAVFLGGLLSVWAVLPFVRRAAGRERGLRRASLFLPFVILLAGPLVVAVVVKEIGPVGVMAGIGATLLIWSAVSLLVVWDLWLLRAVRGSRDKLLARRPEMATRMRANRFMRWILGKG